MKLSQDNFLLKTENCLGSDVMQFGLKIRRRQILRQNVFVLRQFHDLGVRITTENWQKDFSPNILLNGRYGQLRATGRYFQLSKQADIYKL